jgi:ABC-type multidrug transport system permease subunit
MGVIVRIAVAIVFVGLLFLGLQAVALWREAQSSSGFFSLDDLTQSLATPINLIVGTVAGILCSALAAALRTRTREKSLGRAFSVALSARSLVVATIAAPAVIAGRAL